MAVKYSTRKWNSKKYAKRVPLKADFAVSWAQKEVVEPNTWVQNPLDSAQRCLSTILVGSKANGPSKNIVGTQSCPQRGIFWLLLTDFET